MERKVRMLVLPNISLFCRISARWLELELQFIVSRGKFRAVIMMLPSRGGLWTFEGDCEALAQPVCITTARCVVAAPHPSASLPPIPVLQQQTAGLLTLTAVGNRHLSKKKDRIHLHWQKAQPLFWLLLFPLWLCFKAHSIIIIKQKVGCVSVCRESLIFTANLLAGCEALSSRREECRVHCSKWIYFCWVKGKIHFYVKAAVSNTSTSAFYWLFKSSVAREAINTNLESCQPLLEYFFSLGGGGEVILFSR